MRGGGYFCDCREEGDGPNTLFNSLYALYAHYTCDDFTLHGRAVALNESLKKTIVYCGKLWTWFIRTTCVFGLFVNRYCILAIHVSKSLKLLW